MRSFISSQWIETQFNYQNSLNNIVCLVYDLVRTEEGTLSIHAYRLTKGFMNVMCEGEYSSLGFARGGVLFSSIIEEVPISLYNSSLINDALVDLEYGDQFSGANDVELSRLSISDHPVLEKSMEFLICDLDTLGKEQSKYSHFMHNLVRSHGHVLERLREWRAESRSKGPNSEPAAEDDDVIQLVEKEPMRPKNKIFLISYSSIVTETKKNSEYELPSPRLTLTTLRCSVTLWR